MSILQRSVRTYFKIHGSVQAGYEPVRKSFTSLYEKGVDTHSQLSVYVEGKEVVNIYGNTPHLSK